MQSKIKVDTTGLNPSIIEQLNRDIAYFQEKYDGRSGDDLTESEVDDIMKLPIEAGMVDYAMAVILGHTNVRALKYVVPTAPKMSTNEDIDDLRCLNRELMGIVESLDRVPIRQ